MKAVIRVSLAVAVVWLVYFLRGNVCLRLYPAVMGAIAFAVFALSSLKTPIVEKIARRRGEMLDERGVRYCRVVNNCWTVFLFLHLAVTVLTVFASPETWAFYNGFLAYVLLGTMFAAEWAVRRRMRGKCGK